VSRNLTSDAETRLGRWSEAQVVTALRDGRSGGRVLVVFGMPWIYFHSFTAADATAIARYLKMLPPVHNRIPPLSGAATWRQHSRRCSTRHRDCAGPPSAFFEPMMARDCMWPRSVGRRRPMRST
jgi:hypothetical protein